MFIFGTTAIGYQRLALIGSYLASPSDFLLYGEDKPEILTVS